MANSTKKAEVIVTVNSQQAQHAVKAMQKELSRLENIQKQMIGTTKEGSKRFKDITEEIKSLKAVLKETKTNMDSVDKVVKNLSQSSLSQLKRALTNVKKSMNTASEDSPRLEKLRKQYKAISDQIKVLEGSYVNIGKHINDLSARTDSWLNKAIRQQKDYIATIDKTGHEYNKQMAILQKLEAEESKRASMKSMNTINTNYADAIKAYNAPGGIGAMSAQQLRDARSALVAKRDTLSTGANAAEIENINKLLKETELELDKIAGKEQKVEPLVKTVAKDVFNLTKNLNQATPEQLRKGLEACRAQLDKMGSGDPRRKAWVQWAKQLETALANVDKEAVDVKKVLANLKTTPLDQLKQAAKQLEEEMAKLTRGQKDYVRKSKELQKVKAEINSVTGAVQKQSSAFGTTLKNLTAYFGLFQLFSKVQQMLTNVVRLNLRFNDQLADIRKVSGLAMKDIDQLAVNLAKIDTRTSIEELNKLAYAGAKLGMGKYGIGGLEQFTRAANMVNVALKEDLGEDALKELSKLVEVMGLIPQLGVEQSMLKAGSAIFKLGATSTATGANIIQFSKRLMGLADTAGITTDQLLAIGSASDAMGLMPEVSATAFNKMITAMQTNHNLIEQNLNLTKGTINEYFKQGKMMEAIVKVFEQMNKMGNMNALKPIFKDLGSDGARLNLVMTTMAAKINMLKDHLNVANEAFREGTAVTEEYIIQQNTAQALLQRASNIWEKSFVNPSGVSFVKDLAQDWYDFSKALNESSFYMNSIKGTLIALWGVVRAVIAILPQLIQYFMFAGVYNAVRGLVNGFIALRSAILTAAMAQKTLNSAMAANIFGAIATVIATVAIALWDYTHSAEEATSTQEELNRALADARVEADKQTAGLDSYVKALENVNLTEQQRMDLLNKFNMEYRGYIDKLGIEIKTVGDLKKAYKDLNAELRKKQFYELRERYKSEKTDELKINRMEAGQEYKTQLQKMGVGGFDVNWLKANEKRGTKAIYDEIIRTAFPGATEVKGTGRGRWAVRDNSKWNGMRDVGNDELFQAIDDWIKNYHEENKISKQADEAFKEEVGDYDPILEKIFGDLEREAPDKKGDTERRKALAERKKQLRQELKQAQDEAKAIIDNIKNFYQRQITQVLQTANEQNWDTSVTDAAVRSVEARMNLALSQARKGIAGVKNSWDDFKQTMDEDMREQADEVGYNESAVLLKSIQENNLDALRKKMATLSKSLNMPETAVTDAIWKNATMNEKANESAEIKQRKEINKRLLERNYTAKVNDEYTQSMETLGFFDIDEQQLSDLMSKDKDKAEQMLKNRTEEIYSVLMNAREHIADLYAIKDVGTAEGRNAFLDVLFGPDYDQSASTLKKVFQLNTDEIKLFYDELLKYQDAYVEAQKKAREEAQKVIDERWNQTGIPTAVDTYTQSNDILSQLHGVSGVDQTTSMQLGMANNIGTDPEIKSYEMKMNAAKAYYDFVKASTDDQILIQQAQRQSMEAMMAYAMKVGAAVADQVKNMQAFMEPLNSFAEEVGQKFGDAIFNVESSSKRWSEIIKEMILAYARMMIEMTTRNLSMKLQQALFYKQMEIQAQLHQDQLLLILMAGGMAQVQAQAGINAAKQAQKSVDDALTISKEAKIAAIMAAFGISEGAAKTIAALGIWGIPLIGLISSLLLGLLASALSSAGGDSSAATQQGQNVKLATGMLTYDSGNVQSFGGGQNGGQQGQTQTVVGNDGNVYQTQHVDKLSTGLVTKPISTMVNGQPAVVGEKGPEMVIGRETTQAMMMNRPDLMNEIVKFDKNRSGMHYRMYDEGNLADFAEGIAGTDAAAAPSLSQEDVQQLRGAITEFTAMMLLLQKNGLHVNKYGRGGIAEEAEDGAQFMGRYSGSRLWNKKK